MMIAILLYVAAAAIGIVLGSLLPSFGKPPATSVAKDVILLVLIIGVYKLFIVRLGKRPRDDLRPAGAISGLATGIAAGIAIFSAIVAIAYLLGVYRVVGRGNSTGIAVALVSVGLVPAFTEELLFRGILFRWMEELAGSWAAIAVTSALFGIAHIFNPGATWFSSFAIAVEAGLLLGAVYMLTRSLWMPVGLHAAWNFAEGSIFGVAVSGGPSSGLIRPAITGPTLLTGGSFGLEASLIAVVVATGAGLCFLAFAIRRGELVGRSLTGRA